MKIEVHFLGQPEIYVDGKRLALTQKKLEAMLLYLLFNVSCTRDELAAVFWGGINEEAARRNLRGSLYKIRGLLGRGFLSAEGKTRISLDPELEVWRDTDLFVMENSEQRLIELNSFCFLDKFYLKNCPEFEEWVCCMQNTYERLLEERLLPAMRVSLEKGRQVLAQRYAECILRFNAHNEEAVYVLMKLCEQGGDYNKAAFIYTRFAERLFDDMRLEPGSRTKKEYENIMRIKAEERRGREKEKGPFCLGHMKAAAALREEYSKFIRGCSSENCILCGEEGMDKEEVWYQFAKEQSANVIQVQIRREERGLPWSAARRLFLKIAEGLSIPAEEVFSGREPEAALLFAGASDRLARRASSLKKRPVVMIHGLEAMDRESKALVLGYFMERFRGILFISASLNLSLWEEETGADILPLASGFRKIILEPLKEGECSRYLKECLPDKRELLVEEKQLFYFTAGNLFMLRTVAENLSKGEEPFFIRREFRERFLGLFYRLGRKERQYLELLAVMENGAEVEVMAELLAESPAQVMEELKRLEERGFLSQIPQKGHERLRLRSGMFRGMIYREIPCYRKKELHRLAFSCYERDGGGRKTDLFLLTELKYHSLHGGLRAEGLRYSIRHLRYLLDYYDEFFPAVPQDVEFLRTLALTRREINRLLDGLQSGLNKLESELGENEAMYFQMELYYLRGRSLNRDGKREKGLIYAERLISLAKSAGNEKMLLNGYIEALCYGVKAEDAALMSDYLERVKKMEISVSYPAEYGTILRLEGYCLILQERYEEAEKKLKQSIEIFEKPGFRNIYYYRAAGAWDYLAISHRKRGEYEKARAAMEKAIHSCENRGSRKGLDLFYEDYGYILFLQENYREAETYFRMSASLYDEYGTYWLRSVGESCMAMISLEKGEEKEALEYFRRAEIFSRKEKTKEEISVLETARGKLKEKKVLN